jgi:hypothetical protein
MAGMTCTQCFKQTDTEPKFDGFPIEVVTEMCKNWLCDTCLDDLEREIIALPKPKSS